MKKDHSRGMRWLVLTIILLNIAFNGLYTAFSGNVDIAQVSRSFHDLFTPANYVFGIWGVIYTSFVIYAIVQLLPSQREVAIYDRLSVPLILANILGSAWIIAFTHRNIVASLVILMLTLVISIVLFVRSGRAVMFDGNSRWLWIPFSLFCGWISVAFIADSAVTLISLGWNGGVDGPEPWTICMIVVASLLALIVDFKFKNYIYPLVIVWASIGIYKERQLNHPLIATVALTSAVIILSIVLIHQVIIFSRTSRVH